jgi:uncharacterized protein with HEPN domain
MPEEERRRLESLLERMALVSGWIEGLTEPQFLNDEMLRDAAAMSLLVIGETCRRLSDATRRDAPEVPWSAIVSMRNRIAHGYESVDHRIVWRILVEDLPALAVAIRRLR